MPGYPIELDLIGRLAVVIGLGAVGLRKASGLLEAGARVVGVDPLVRAAPSGIELRAEDYRAEHLEGACLAFAAATAEVNRQVVADARRMGLWVNSASEPSRGNFTLPATWRDGSLTLTVSTSGASPALAASLRDRAVEALGPSAPELVRVLEELRPEVLEAIADPVARRRALKLVAEPRWLELLATEGAEATRNALREAIGVGRRLST